MAKKVKITPAVVPEEPKVVSVIDDYAFLLNDNPEAINTMQPQAILHAALPRTVNKTKIMPPGSTFADTWMLKYGNPLSSVDAAMALLKEVEPKIMYVHADVYFAQRTRVGLYLNDPDSMVAEGVSETLPGALVIALLNYLSAKEKQ